ncbi:hypothetical protein ACFQNE_13480 [Gordonia phosphorivorans]|uniref:DUF4115 domain-containing protein n=1 Tax=Gordonia phosphorivorans TaxID=1056982 RepID=A0ABV6H3X2_9ACTN
MTRPPHAPRPAPPYRPPVARGQTYPALGFADDGTPQYQYQPPTPAAALSVTPPTQPPAGPPTSPPEPPRDPLRRMLGGLAAVLILVLLVAAALTFFSGGDDADTRFAERSAPPATQPLDDPYLDDLENPRSSADPNAPQSPRSSAPRPSAPGTRGTPLPTVYEVTTESLTTVVFLGQGRMRVAEAPGGRWTEETVTYGDARLTLLVPEGEAASCRITVDGVEVASQEVEPSTTVRLLTCEG